MLNSAVQVVSRLRRRKRLSPLTRSSQLVDARQVAHLQIARSLRYLEKNWHRPINVGHLYKAAGMSRRGFVKAFTKHLSRTPSQELERLRMEHARQLVLRPGHSLRQTALSCGYRSINSFLVAFRRINGMSPTRFVRQHASRPPAPCRNVSSDRNRSEQRHARRRYIANVFFKSSVRRHAR